MTRLDPLIANYRRRSWWLVPIPAGKKGPVADDWQLREWKSEDFRPGGNVGVILGPRSGDLVDIDLDCPEALVLADRYLPSTGAEFGLASKPRSHRLYIAASAAKESFADPLREKENTLLELRAAGKDGGAHQTLFPPSIADGERREWHADTEPATIGAPRLRILCAWLAVGCLVARYVSVHAAERPGHDLPNLLWEADRDLGRVAFKWLGQRDPEAPQYQPKRRSDLDAREIAVWDLAQAIPNENLSWDDWNAFGLAFWAASNGSEEGFIGFDRFSAKCAKYNGPETCARWRHFAKSPPSDTGVGKLIKAALAAGWRPEPATGGRHGR